MPRMSAEVPLPSARFELCPSAYLSPYTAQPCSAEVCSCPPTRQHHKWLTTTGDFDNSHREVYGDHEHKSKFSHELLGGAAAFEGMKLFEDHQRKEGKPVSHKFAKEAIAGLIGAEVDKLAETKGMDEIDKIKAHQHAKKHAESMYDDHYVGRHGASEYDPSRYGKHESFTSRGW